MISYIDESNISTRLHFLYFSILERFASDSLILHRFLITSLPIPHLASTSEEFQAIIQGFTLFLVVTNESIETFLNL
jgi:hypothetical protein